MEMVERPVDVAWVADYLRLSEWTVKRKARYGEIPAHKPGRAWLFYPSEIEAHLKAPVAAQSAQSRGRKRTA